MTIPIEIQGSMTRNGISKAEVYNPVAEGRNGEPGLAVYTRERLEKSFVPIPLFSPFFGIALNQNGEFSGTPEPVHNGIDNVYWTGTEPVGTKVTFSSADRAFAGSFSVKIDNPNAGDIWQFDKGSNLTIANYTALTLKVNIDQDWDSGDSVSFYGYDTGGAVQVGNKVLLQNYIDITSFDVWQPVTIPFTDMGLSGTIDAFRMEQEAKSGKAARWYLDNFQVEETGNPINYRYEPNGDTIFHVTRAQAFVVVDGVSEAALQAYDKFYSLPQLTNGVGAMIQVGGNIIVNTAENDLRDQIQQPQVVVQTGGDGTNSWMKVFHDLEFALDGRKRDFIEYRVQDDLTGLAVYSVWLFGWPETVGAEF